MMLRNLDWNFVLDEIKSMATSMEAKSFILETVHFASASEAEESVRNIFAAQEILSVGPRPFMESLDLFEAWFQRLKKKATLKPLEIKDVRHFCQEALALKESLKLTPSFIQSPASNATSTDTGIDSEIDTVDSWAVRTEYSLMKAEEPLSAIDQILTIGGEIRSDASEKLFNLYNEKTSLMRQVHSNLDRLVKDHQLENVLQDKYVTTREGRWVLPIRSGMRHYLEGIIHSSSQTKQTVYMEPELVVPLNNRIRQIEVEIEEEIERLLFELSQYLQSKNDEFAMTKKIMIDVDILLAKSQWALLTDSQPFTFADPQNPAMELVQVRHPLLVTQQKKVVSNSITLEPKKSILLLSGPNAGGKTVLLKSIGLAAQMSRCGLPILAESSSVIPFFKDITVGIGDTQSIGEDLSTFAGHLKILHSASLQKGFDHLVLVDEICGSTDPEEGSGLARSFIEEFAANHIFAVITSHLGPLKSGWKDTDVVLNGSLEYDRNSGRPTYQFLQGVAGDSLALQTAQRVGVPTHILDRAKQFLTPESRARLSAMEELEKMKSDMILLQEHLRKELQQTKFEKSRLMAEKTKLEKEREQILKQVEKDAQKKVEEAITHAKVEDTFKRHRTLQDIKYNLPEIVKAPLGEGNDAQSGGHWSGNNENGSRGSNGGSAGGGSGFAIKTSEEFAKRFPAGTKIFVPRLNQDGIVQSTPNSKGEVQILSGSLRISLHWQDLKPAQKSTNMTSEILRRSSSVSPQFVVVDADRSLDLRGKTTEEAIEILEVELDQAAIRKEDRIKIIHGHGTEALKKAVRAYLSRSLYVKKWKAGASDQGGDGITWVELSSGD